MPAVLPIQQHLLNHVLGHDQVIQQTELLVGCIIFKPGIRIQRKPLDINAPTAAPDHTLRALCFGSFLAA